MTTPLRAILLARVSTGEQAEHGTSLAEQQRRLREEAERRGWTVVREVVEGGVSGAATDRPMLVDALRMLRDDEADVLVATKLDRLVRSLAWLGDIVAALDARGGDAHLVVLDDGIDTQRGGAMARLQVGILGAVAEFERARIRARTVEGRAAAARDGRLILSTPPYGYRIEPDPRRLVQHDAEAAVVRLVYETVVCDGGTPSQACAALANRGMTTRSGDPWTAQWLADWMRRPSTAAALSGTVMQDGHAYRIADPILSPLEAKRWRAWAAKRAVGAPARRWSYLLSGMIVAPCGGTMTGRRQDERRRAQYICRDAASGHRDAHPMCFPVDAADFEALVWRSVVRAIEQAGALDASAAALDDEDEALAELTRREEAVEVARAARIAAYRRAAAVLDDPADIREAIADEDAALRSAQAALASWQGATLRRERASAVAVDDLRARLHDADEATKRAVLEALNARVTIDGYRACEACDGTGYAGIKGQSGRGFAPRCERCRGRKRLPDRPRIALDPVVVRRIAGGQ